MGGHKKKGSTFDPRIPTPTLKDFYNTGENADYSVFGEGGDAQVFTPAEAYTLTSVKVKLRADSVAPNPGTVKIGIQSTGGNDGPSGNYLTSAQFDTSDLPIHPAASQWCEIVFPEPVHVSAGTKYALVVDAFENPPETKIRLRVHINTGAYPGGETWGGMVGFPWAKLNDGLDDLMFECWGY